eukprot:3676638-Ditylum_brightwellii.AAC.1
MSGAWSLRTALSIDVTTSVASSTVQNKVLVASAFAITWNIDVSSWFSAICVVGVPCFTQRLEVELTVFGGLGVENFTRHFSSLSLIKSGCLCVEIVEGWTLPRPTVGTSWWRRR